MSSDASPRLSTRAARERLVLMNGLERIQPNRDGRRVKAGEDRANINEANRAKQHRDRPVEADGPAKGLFINDKNQDQRKEIAQRGAGDVGEQAEKSGFDDDKLADLSGGRAKESQQAELATAVDDQGEKGPGNSHDGHDDRNRLQRIGDGEGAVEDA